MIVSPGPATLSMAAVGSAFGFTRGVPYLMGCASGLIMVMIAVAIGLAQLVEVFPGIGYAAGLLGVGYIFFLAYRIATQDPGTSKLNSPGSPGFLAGIIVSLSNPKGWAVMGALFSSLGPINNVITSNVLIRISILCAITVLGNLAWTMLGDRLSSVVTDPARGRMINRMFALLLVVSVIWALLL
ncbi:MAG: LysE family translocator [bacterium]